MATGQPRTFPLWLALGLALPGFTVGCSQPNFFTSRQTMIGGLKASVSQLEFENEKLKKEVGELTADNNRLDNQLVQERDANGEIAARLDDAKDMIRRQGGNAQAVGIGSNAKSFEDDDVPPPVDTPRSRKVKNRRNPPTVRIPGFGPSASDFNDDVSYHPPDTISRDLGPADRDDDSRWLPVARGSSSSSRVRQ